MLTCKPRLCTIQIVLIMIMGVIFCACKNDSNLEYKRERDPKYEHLQHVGYLKDGKKHGRWLTYSSGQLEQLATWKDGVQHGPLIRWSLYDGLIYADRYFVKGKQEGRSRHFGGDDNRLTWMTWWQRGAPHGFWCKWTDDGVLREIVEYHEGRHVRTEAQPNRPCPYTEGELGKHHFDPSDRTYQTPYRKTRNLRRAIRTFN